MRQGIRFGNRTYTKGPTVAIVRRMVSDITGTEAEESEFVSLIIREHPEIEEPKALDVLPAEVSNLKSAGNLVTIEIGENGDKKTVVVTLAEFRKLIPDETVKAARPTRGRRPGYSPKS